MKSKPMMEDDNKEQFAATLPSSNMASDGSTSGPESPQSVIGPPTPVDCYSFTDTLKELPSNHPPSAPDSNFEPRKTSSTPPPPTSKERLKLQIQSHGGMIPPYRLPFRTSSTQSISPTSVPPVDSPKPSPTQSSHYLVALAAQERRVMELKEELQQAEAQLMDLKRQWAAREARRKRDDIRRLQPLESLNTRRVQNGVGGRANDDAAMEGTRQEHQRRKAMSVNTRPSSTRKVIAGQKHTRALSLLSPERLDHPASVLVAQPERQMNGSGERRRRSTTASSANLGSRDPNSPREVTDDLTTMISPTKTSFDPQSRDAFLRTGRQMAEGFKEGLWSFLDDIRQATVGEEAIRGRQTRPETGYVPVTSFTTQTPKARPRSQILPSSRPETLTSGNVQKSRRDQKKDWEKASATDIDDAFWKEYGVN